MRSEVGGLRGACEVLSAKCVDWLLDFELRILKVVEDLLPPSSVPNTTHFAFNPPLSTLRPPTCALRPPHFALRTQGSRFRPRPSTLHPQNG